MNRFSIILCVAFISSTNVSGEQTMIDEKKLLEYRKNTTVAGAYLVVWKIVEAHLSKNTHLKLDEYIVNFDEDDKSFHVRLSKPFKVPVLGGGIGTCSVDKKTHDVQCKLIR